MELAQLKAVNIRDLKQVQLKIIMYLFDDIVKFENFSWEKCMHWKLVI